MHHHLDIHAYSLQELFDLFKIPNKREITTEYIKQAKKITLQMHPDKSQLPPEYFLFYKKAFDIIVKYYENQQKVSQIVPLEKEIEYEPLAKDMNEKEIAKQIQKISAEKSFHKKFNDLFEENMREKPDPTKNEWFTNENAIFETSHVKSVSQMNETLEKIKEKTNAMSIYRGVQNLTHSGGSHIYNTDDTDEYITSDPFSKLKYEDLRKVHKDQTVFMVSETDLDNVPKYGSVDAYKTERTQNQHQWKPVDKVEGERVLSEQEKIRKEIMLRKAEQARIQENVYAEKNRKVMSAFLQLR